MTTYTHSLCALLILLCGASAGLASPRADALLDTIDVFLTPSNMKEVGIDASYAERALLDRHNKRYRRVRALGALSILAPARAFELLPKLAIEDQDSEVRAQSVIHLVRVFGVRQSGSVRSILADVREARKRDHDLCALIDAELKRARRVASPEAKHGGL
jgi:hypothetical protein